MSETWFVAWMNSIEPVMVDKYSDQSVWVTGKRKARDGWQFYAPTWEAAHQHLIKEANIELLQSQSALDRAKNKLSVIKQMVKP